ncbi:LLM class flavin-dependent oxidoreductase [Cryptosporangium sp. NPDC048952]|uniref:LLM class flavin-dependent oxidoreductase n=1 Tax=Cryptosporangium sp. NPDC048952 TaxID=3363961 RepID=UPI003716B562
MRLHALLLPDQPWEVLVSRARVLEALGVASLWVDDHIAHPARPSGPWLDAWSVLAGLSQVTTRIGLGTLVSNPVLRPPATLARQALSIEHLSGGRLELGLGSGYSPGDHAAAGVPLWPGPERAAHFRTFVATVAATVRGAAAAGSSAAGGEGAGGEGAGIGGVPGPWAPRPTRKIPLTVAAHGPRALRVAAEYGDRWVSYGGFGLTAAEHLDVTRRRADALHRACEETGRDPSTLRKALLLGSKATTEHPIWTSADRVREHLARYEKIGIDDAILYYPPSDVWPPGEATDGVFEELWCP